MDPETLRELERLGVELPREVDPADAPLRVRASRPVVDYADKNARFILTESGFERQFAQTYFCRYHEMKPHLETSAQSKWPETPMCKILGIKELGLEEVVLCGILFKSMKLKPQVLDKYLSKRVVEKELQSNKNRVHEEDLLFLEDEGTRTELTGAILPVHQLVSGMCIALKGRQLADGRFDVIDICCAGFAPQLPFPETKKNAEAYLMLVSGLNLATIRPHNRLALDMLAEYLAGSFGDDENIPPRVVRVVVCGGLIGRNEDLATGSPNSRQQLRALEPILDVDGFLSEIVRSVPVDVMPGLHDPASYLMPQQPLHKCLFPHASEFGEHLCRVTNPHDFVLNGIHILGTSGQNISDILLHSNLENGIEALEQCLRYRHLAPTCPDTLTCFPFNQSDPFVLEKTPHIFFAGNQASFETRLLQGHQVTSRLICVPDFSLKSQAVLVNLRNLETQVLSLDASLTAPHAA